MRALALGKGLGLVKLDPVKEKLQKFDIKDDAEVDKIKDLIKSLKESSKEIEKKEDTTAPDAKEDNENVEKVTKRRAGAINIYLFMKVKDTALFSQE